MKKTSFTELVRVMQKLRSPGGCPWDREQTHASLLKYIQEEAAELARAVKKKDMENMEEELADVLLQVLFHAQIAKENGHFDIYDVVDTLKTKLVLRHPHVFSKNAHNKKWTSKDVLKNWGELKVREKKIRTALRKKRKAYDRLFCNRKAFFEGFHQMRF